MIKMTPDEILDQMEILFPDAHCELFHTNAVELVIAVVLSAQTTDEAVNKVTPALFERFKTIDDYIEADVKEIETYIKRIGLYHNKAKNVKELAVQLKERYDGEVPSSMKDLTTLPGVGRKTANVVQSVWFDIPAFAVDTHVDRISKRLGLAKPSDDVLEVEKKLKRKLKRERWNKGHHLFIFFGRYFCTARNPKCEECPFISFCRKDKLDAYKASKAKSAL